MKRQLHLWECVLHGSPILSLFLSVCLCVSVCVCVCVCVCECVCVRVWGGTHHPSFPLSPTRSSAYLTFSLLPFLPPLPLPLLALSLYIFCKSSDSFFAPPTAARIFPTLPPLPLL